MRDKIDGAGIRFLADDEKLMSQSDIAKFLGMSQAAVDCYEKRAIRKLWLKREELQARLGHVKGVLD